ncbi:MAG: glycosyltransferase 87 family protein [Actinobacteria bacterium]|nr:glycosyltransferase 87 family protein [Actinomycetota bacterium]MCA1720552.1 glycosyltransferase 87 family protein [Actinomycetota bacterium]
MDEPKRRALGLPVIGLLLSGGAEVWLAHRTTGPDGILERRYGLLGLIGLWTLAYGVAVLCALRLPRRYAVGLVLLIAVVLRLAAIAPKAPLSDDLYRYAWDGVVQTEGIDPYRYAPADRTLVRLREGWLWPPGYVRVNGSDTRINRPAVRTIYPPVAEGWFFLEHQIVPLSAQDRGYESVGLLLDLAVLGVLLALLRDRRWIALYALAPLPVLEVVQNAHVDGLAVLLTLGALVLSERRRPTAAVAVLALATLTKVYPALLLPLLLRDRGKRVQGTAVFAAVCVTSYLPHLLAVGTRIVGYLPGYLQEEDYSTGTRYLLLGLVGLRGAVATAAAVLLLAGIGIWALRTTLPLRAAAVRLMAATLLVVTPVQPWYAVLLLALATLSRAWAVVPLTVAAYPVYFGAVLDGPYEVYGRISYAVAAVAVVAGYRLRSNRSA